MDLHATGSEGAGWKVEGNSRYLRNVATNKNAVGVWFNGNSNTMHNGNAVENTGIGLLIDGNSNLVDSTDSFSNGGHGIQVTGIGNTIKKTDIGDRGKGNGGDGLNVFGSGNDLQENDAYSNGGNGIKVEGGANTLSKNTAGERGDKANTTGRIPPQRWRQPDPEYGNRQPEFRVLVNNQVLHLEEQRQRRYWQWPAKRKLSVQV